jgi:hypothetical protein
MSVRNETEFLLETTEQIAAAVDATVAEFTDVEKANPAAAASMVMASLHASVDGTQLAELRRIALEKTSCYAAEAVVSTDACAVVVVAPEEDVEKAGEGGTDAANERAEQDEEADADKLEAEVDTAAGVEVDVEAAMTPETAAVAEETEVVEQVPTAAGEAKAGEAVDTMPVAETDPGESASVTQSDVSSASTVISDLNKRVDFLIGMLDSRLSYVESMVKFARPHDGHSTLGMHRDVMQEFHKSKEEIENDAKFRKACKDHPFVQDARRVVFYETQ